MKIKLKKANHTFEQNLFELILFLLHRDKPISSGKNFIINQEKKSRK
jgi:hypothetical protein